SLLDVAQSQEPCNRFAIRRRQAFVKIRLMHSPVSEKQVVKQQLQGNMRKERRPDGRTGHNRRQKGLQLMGMGRKNGGVMEIAVALSLSGPTTVDCVKL